MELGEYTECARRIPRYMRMEDERFVASKFIHGPRDKELRIRAMCAIPFDSCLDKTVSAVSASPR